MKLSLTKPDQELAGRILATVPYHERLPAGRLRPPVGILAGSVRSLHELHLLLTPDDRSLPGISMSALADWVETRIGDAELGRRMREGTAAATSYVEACLVAYRLVERRLAQARKAVGAGGVS